MLLGHWYVSAMQKQTPRSLSPALVTGLDGEPSPAAPPTHSRRGVAHRSRRPGKGERRRLILLAIPVSSHARTVPGPASLGSDSTSTPVPMADGSNAEERHHRFRWTTTMSQPGVELDPPTLEVDISPMDHRGGNHVMITMKIKVHAECVTSGVFFK